MSIDPRQPRPAAPYRGEGGQSGSQAGGFDPAERTDERIREDVRAALTRIAASGVETTVDGGEVTLTGTVADRAAEQLAERSVAQVAGVQHVHSRLAVAH